MSGRNPCLAVVICSSLGLACHSLVERRSSALAEADAAVVIGDLTKATKILRRALAYDPRDTEIAVKLAEVLSRADEHWRALAVLKEVPADAPTNSRYLNLRARLSSKCGRVDEGLRILNSLDAESDVDRDALRLVLERAASERNKPDPDHPLPVGWQVTIAEKQLDDGLLGSAAEWIVALPKDHPARGKLADDLLAALLAADPSEIAEDVAGLAEPADTAAKLLIRRRYLSQQKAWSFVAALEGRFLSEYPDHPAWSEVALATAFQHLRSGQIEEAKELAERAAFLDPKNVEALVVRGLALKMLGEPIRAREAFELALGLDPAHGPARVGLEGLRRSRGTSPSSIEIDLEVHGSSTRLP